jgi:hypothetical protein
MFSNSPLSLLGSHNIALLMLCGHNNVFNSRRNRCRTICWLTMVTRHTWRKSADETAAQSIATNTWKLTFSSKFHTYCWGVADSASNQRLNPYSRAQSHPLP